MFKALLISLITLLVHAGEPVNVVVPTYRGYSAKDAPGYLNSLLDLFEIEGVKFHYIPLKRAAKDYFQKKHDCFMGMSKMLMDVYGLDSKGKIFSDSYLKLTAKLLTKNEIKGKKNVCSLSEMEGKTIIALEGFPIKKLFKGVKLKDTLHVGGIKQSYKILASGRGDALIGFFPSSLPEFYALNSCHTFFTSFESMHCWDSSKNRVAIEKFNQRLEKLKNSGQLKKLEGQIYSGAKKRPLK